MTHSSEALAGTSEQASEQSKQVATPDQFETVLNSLTEPEWYVKSAAQKPSKVVAEPPIFTAILEHESGSIIQIIPIDSERYRHDSPHFDAHRIRLENKFTDSPSFVVCDRESKRELFLLSEFSIPAAATQGTTELPIANDAINLTTTEPQADVYASDGNTDSKEFAEQQIGRTVTAVIGATQRVNQEYQTQSGLGDFK